MSDEQPTRSPNDPGPDWWPRFGWRTAAIWVLQGFLVPLGIYLGIWLLTSTGISITSGEFFSENAIRNGVLIATLGLVLSGGSMGFALVMSQGAKWSTLFRFVGFALSIFVQWQIGDVLMETYF